MNWTKENSQAAGLAGGGAGEVVLEARSLVKRFQGVAAIDGVGLRVRSREVFGVAGLNGAGKSTLLMMLAGVLAPDSGSVLHRGIDIHGGGARRAALGRSCALRVGYVPQEIAAFPNLTALDNLRFFAAAPGRACAAGGADAAIKEAAHMAGLSSVLRVRLSALSGGMKRRLNIAAALAMRPDALIMDEPTAGLDAKNRRDVVALIRDLASGGLAVIYTSHQTGELERLSDMIMVIHEGRSVGEGAADELCERFGAQSVDDILCGLGTLSERQARG